MRPSRLNAWRDALTHFVESRDEAEWMRDEDREPLALVRGLLWPLGDLCADAMRAALSAARAARPADTQPRVSPRWVRDARAMPDVYATIDQAPEALQHQLADVLELRAADAQQRAMLEAYLADVPLSGARVLEIGCGTGAICRRLARDAATVLGIDPSPVFVKRAQALAPELDFQVADGRELPFGNDTFDVVVCHTALCHIPDCERVLSEARRVAQHLAIFEGDYATTTVAIADNDPLQPCADATVEGSCTTAGSSAGCPSCSPTPAGR